LHQGNVERRRHEARHCGDADVPGNVALAFSLRDAKPAERTRDGIARMIGDNQQG
jgi:hypothetical protein